MVDIDAYPFAYILYVEHLLRLNCEQIFNSVKKAQKNFKRYLLC